MAQEETFSILDSVDSTNNYAMAQVHAGLATHGKAWFCNSQESGKGQRGKGWHSNPGENILMSILVQPPTGSRSPEFSFNAAISLACVHFLNDLTHLPWKVKWPNDIYWGDRKAGGILIENVIQGNSWNWSVIGIGINVNQETFPGTLTNPVSLKLINSKTYSPVDLARELQLQVLKYVEEGRNNPVDTLARYNEHLYKKGESVRLKKGTIVFGTTIREIDLQGQLVTQDAIERHFHFGEVEWLFP